VNESLLFDEAVHLVEDLGPPPAMTALDALPFGIGLRHATTPENHLLLFQVCPERLERDR
jgi:hypothetical protein